VLKKYGITQKKTIFQKKFNRTISVQTKKNLIQNISDHLKSGFYCTATVIPKIFLLNSRTKKMHHLHYVFYE